MQGIGLSVDPESLFVPFKAINGAVSSSWLTTKRPKAASSLRSVWLSSLTDSSSAHYTAVVEPGTGHRLGPVSASTGLGLPLSREFAGLCGGWLGLEDDPNGVTHFWCVLPLSYTEPLPLASPDPFSPPPPLSPGPFMPARTTTPLMTTRLSSAGDHREMVPVVAAPVQQLPEPAAALITYKNLRVVVVDGTHRVLIVSCVIMMALLSFRVCKTLCDAMSLSVHASLLRLCVYFVCLKVCRYGIVVVCVSVCPCVQMSPLIAVLLSGCCCVWVS